MRFRTASAMVVVALLAFPGLATAAAPANDDQADALELPRFEFASADTSDATIEADELLTENDPDGLTCTADGTRDADGAVMGHTVWYFVKGTGDDITVSSFDSDFDSVLAVYDENGDLVGCEDDLYSGDDFVSTGGHVVIPSETGKFYMVQVGGNGNESGDATVIATDSVPANDDRADAEDLTGASGPLVRDNVGATVEPGEDVKCEVTGSNVGSTVWFKYTAPAPGTATFTSTGFDTVLQVYRGAETVPLACNDDGIPGQAGPSRVSVKVTAGTYLVQVGGYEAYDDFNLNVSAEFARNLDVDADGSTVPGDCDDGNATIHPGAPDPRGDGIDQNCDTVDGEANDRDGDGSFVPADCDDANPAIHPGATDIRGDKIDQDCRNGDAKPIPVAWDYSVFISADGHVTKLEVKAAKGAKVTVSCRGGGCPGKIAFRSKGRVKKLKSHYRSALRTGATITIRAVRKRYKGREARITYRGTKRKVTTRVRCLKPGSTKKTAKC
jgi:hypothetical protein